MATIKNKAGIILDSEITINTIDGNLGLVFESRGGAGKKGVKRNPDYNNALEIILNRLQSAGVHNINVIIVSTVLVKHFTNPISRTIKINNSYAISLNVPDIKDLRIAIGKAQANIKVPNLKKGISPTTAGGSSVKRIQLITSCLNTNDWQDIINGVPLNKKCEELSDFEIFENKVDDLRNDSEKVKDEPKGNSSPQKKDASNSQKINRDAPVKAWVLNNSGGQCECCKSNAPFKKTNSLYYLEVHHIQLLAEGGSDTIDNAIAVCPNCHREFHYGENKNDLIQNIYENVERLSK